MGGTQMSGPNTIPLDEPAPDYARPVTGPITTSHGSTSSHVDQSTNINRPMPWIVLVGILGGLALGLAIAAIIISQLEAQHVQERLAETIKQYRLLDNDWQITNAWLSAHNVKRDEHGNLYFEDPNYVDRSKTNHH